MTVTHVVLAHPETRSFNGAWADASAAAAKGLGHEVLRSDLCAMGFDAVERAEHYPSREANTGFDPLKAQESGELSAQVQGELSKLRRADQVIFHFPIWWFAPPAVLKGWFDRVLAHGVAHTVEERFDTGRFTGKKALFCVTTGANAAECGPDGKEGNLAMLLWPAAQTLRYLGFSVLEPICMHSVHGYHSGADRDALQARLNRTLTHHAKVVEGLPTRPSLRFNPDTDFDVEGRLRVGAPSHSPFIRPRQ